MIEANTGPLITHQMAALSFMSQQLMEQRTESAHEHDSRQSTRDAAHHLPDVIEVQPQHRPDGHTHSGSSCCTVKQD